MSRTLLPSIAGALGPFVVRILGSTWRVQHVREGGARREGKRAQGVIFAFWHGKMLVPAFTHRGKGIGVLVSLHHDGEIIARAVRGLGFLPVRGSTTRGGGPALRRIIGLARHGRDVAFTPDGPRGPRHVVQRGVVYAASRTGIPIVPAAVEASPAWTLGSWDGFTIPRPFSRALILEGEPIRVPPDLDAAGIERARAALQDEMRRLTKEALCRLEGRGSGKLSAPMNG